MVALHIVLDIAPAQTLTLVKSFLPAALQQLSSKSRILQPPKRKDSGGGKAMCCRCSIQFRKNETLQEESVIRGGFFVTANIL
jgi:hypothetical protein